jgi:hypothetical protein
MAVGGGYFALAGMCATSLSVVSDSNACLQCDVWWVSCGQAVQRRCTCARYAIWLPLLLSVLLLEWALTPGCQGPYMLL